METQTKTEHRCPYCEKTFQRETSLSVHVCEQKRRWLDKDERGVQLGLQAFLKFYEIHQGSARFKTFDDFARSPYYRAFVRFGRHCVDINAINPSRYVEWLLEKNKKIDHWYRDSIYDEYLFDYLRREAMTDAIARAIEYSISWGEKHEHPAHDMLRYGNENYVTLAVTNGRVSPWVLYNCESGQRYLENCREDNKKAIWDLIDPDFWSKKFHDYPADQKYAQTILGEAGW